MTVRSLARKGFTLVELLVVITIILLISSLFLGLSPGDGGGLAAGQRVIGSSLRTLRAMALMNRGPGVGGVSYATRYRLLILNDPDDEENHLRQVVLVVGGVSAADLRLDPAAYTDTTTTPYKWFSPEPPQLLPKGVVFVPTASDTGTTMSLAVAAGTRRSVIGQVADNIVNKAPLDSPTSSPPTMRYAPVTQPMALDAISADFNPKTWYYVELQGTGASNHLGRTLLVLALATSRNTGAGKATIDVSGETQFAAISLRPNGDVSMTLDAGEMDTAR